jgi:hypothetical protein
VFGERESETFRKTLLGIAHDPRLSSLEDSSSIAVGGIWMTLADEVGPGLDGLGQMRALMSSGRKPGIMIWLQFDLVQVELGLAAFEGTPGEHAYNPIGTVRRHSRHRPVARGGTRNIDRPPRRVQRRHTERHGW